MSTVKLEPIGSDDELYIVGSVSVTVTSQESPRDLDKVKSEPSTETCPSGQSCTQARPVQRIEINLTTPAEILAARAAKPQPEKGREEERMKEKYERFDELVDDLERLEARRKKRKLTAGELVLFDELSDKIAQMEVELGIAPAPDAESESANFSPRSASVESLAAPARRSRPMQSAAVDDGDAGVVREGGKKELSRKRKKAPRGSAKKPRSKKAKTGRSKSTTSKAAKKKKQPTDRASDFTLGALAMQEPFRARAKIGDVSPPKPFTARTVAAQIKKLRAQALKFNKLKEDTKRMNADVRSLQQTRVALGNRKVKAKDGRWEVLGMKTTLYHHQLSGLGWMLARERAQKVPHGGILADAMGMGKTVELLALVVGHPPTDKNKEEGKGATLVIVPANAIHQWIREIEDHCPRLVHYRFKNSRAREYKTERLGNFDIVVTSYHELAMAYSASQKDEDTPSNPIFDVEFYRIILDEAHIIKGGKSQATQACFLLKGKYRWVVTGTPAMNSLEELYPYMRFLEMPVAATRRDFNQRVFSKEDNEIEKLLKVIMLRRSHDATFMHQPLLHLPPPHSLAPKMVRFSDEEAVVYKWVKDWFIRLGNDYIRRKQEGALSPDEKEKKTKYTFQSILRLRQAISHPFALEPLMREIMQPGDAGALRQKLPSSIIATPLLDAMESWCLRHSKRSSASRSLGPSEFDESQSEVPGSREEIPLEQQNCPLCSEVSTDMSQAQCGHLYCKACMDRYLEGHLTIGKEAVCLRCAKPIGTPRDYMLAVSMREEIRAAREISTGKRTQASSKSKAKRGLVRKAKCRGDDVLGYQPRKNVRLAMLDEADEKPECPLFASAKMKAVEDIIREWQNEAPDDKIIVFVEFAATARILGRRIQDTLKIDFIYYYGDMNLEEKRDRVVAFDDEPNIKILIASMKCGGQALNLTCANRVILMEPWWNQAVEMQAFHRVYRIGQEKETYLVRVLVEDSIDNRMHEVQERKLSELEQTNQEFDPETQNLELKELEEVFGLFGEIREDENGKLVLVDDGEADAANDDTPNDSLKGESSENGGSEGDNSDSDSRDDSDGEYVG